MYFVTIKVTTMKQYRVSASTSCLAARIAFALVLDAQDAGSNVEVVSVEKEEEERMWYELNAELPCPR